MSRLRRHLISKSMDYYIPLTFTAVEANSTIKLTKKGSPTVDGLQYRYGTSGGWNTYTIDNILTLSNVNDVVQFKNTNESLSTSSSNYVKFVMTGKLAGSGNIQSMLNYSESCSSGCYGRMFYECVSLVNSPELPATTLASGCYEYMFYGCTSLTTAPELLSSDARVGCYSRMFSGCTNLISGPTVLPSIILYRSCYEEMFYGCSSLINPPKILATTVQGSYTLSEMFRNCTSLLDAPELFINTYVGDRDYLESTFYGMFNRCSSLRSIKVHFTSWASYYGSYSYWVNYVPSSGTFYKPSSLPVSYGTSRIPTGWSVVNID